MTSTDQQVIAWASESQRAFSFLEGAGYAASPPRLDTAWGSMTFLGRVLGVRLEVVTDEFYMYVALFRRDHPEHENAEYLQACLKRLGKSAKSLDRVLAMRGNFGRLQEIVNAFATELKNSLSTIESGADQLFPL